MAKRVVRSIKQWPLTAWRRLRTPRQKVTAVVIAAVVLLWGGSELHARWNEGSQGRRSFTYVRPFPVMTLSAADLGMCSICESDIPMQLMVTKGPFFL